MKRHTIDVQVGENSLKFETGKIAKQANGSVILHCGETMIMSTACASKEASPDIDFFPLRVDFQEKFSAAGKTLGGFIKREGRPTQRETLMCRLIDRPLRPMFENGYYNEVQVLCYVLSYDGVHNADPLAICAASAALTISDIPLIKPIGAVQVGMIDDQFIINPSIEQMKESKLDLMIAGTEDAVLMIEGFCEFLTEEQALQAIEAGHTAIKTICHALAEWRKEIGKEKKRHTLRAIPEDLLTKVREIMLPELDQAVRVINKQEREEAVDVLKTKVNETLHPEGGEALFTKTDIKLAVKKVQAERMRKIVLEEGVRPDGRKSTDIRAIDVEQALLPRTHGSSLFTRGETQALAVTTLGGETMRQRYETIDEQSSFRFYLQYFFPPYSVGEVGRMGPAGRREVGHGKLAERALTYSLPTEEEFPYTIRLESNITESNGSSSMATVCGGCLSIRLYPI